MMALHLKTIGSRLYRHVARFGADRRGIAAVEFAFIAPIMLVLFLGTIEFSAGLAVYRKVVQGAQTLSDLTSRSQVVTDTDLSNFRIIVNAIMTPFSVAPVKATVSMLYIDPVSAQARAQWSSGDDAVTAGSTVVIPASLVGRDSSGKVIPGQYLIMGSVRYLYVPIVGFVMKAAGVNLSQVAYTRPRQNSCVFYNVTAANCPTK